MIAPLGPNLAASLLRLLEGTNPATPKPGVAPLAPDGLVAALLVEPIPGSPLPAGTRLWLSPVREHDAALVARVGTDADGTAVLETPLGRLLATPFPAATSELFFAIERAETPPTAAAGSRSDAVLSPLFDREASAERLTAGLVLLAASDAAAISAEIAAGLAWRVVPLPAEPNRRAPPGRLAVRDGHDGREADGTARFVLEVAPTATGPVQLDGTVRPGRLDLLVRSQLGLNEAIRAELAIAFQKGLEAAHLTGRLGFSSTWVGFRPERRADLTA